MTLSFSKVPTNLSLYMFPPCRNFPESASFPGTFADHKVKQSTGTSNNNKCFCIRSPCLVIADAELCIIGNTTILLNIFCKIPNLITLNVLVSLGKVEVTGADTLQEKCQCQNSPWTDSHYRNTPCSTQPNKGREKKISTIKYMWVTHTFSLNCSSAGVRKENKA